MSKTYVTGAGGFIGSRLMARLGPEALSVPYDDIYFHRFEGYERLFYLSAYGNAAGQTDVWKTVWGNVLTPVKALVLGQPAPHGGRFVFASTSSVTLPAQTPYSRSKRAAEEALLATADARRRVRIVRPYSVTGVGEQPGHLIPTLIRSCLTGERIPFCGWPTHDYLDVEDAVDGLIAAADGDWDGVFELGTGKATSNDEVRELVEQATGKIAATFLGNAKEYDSRDWRWHDAVRPQGWTPKRTLAETIERMVAHARGS